MHQPISKNVYNYGILLFSILSGGLLALFLGKDLNWDLANYHFYNVYALLHFRYDQDYWPAGINTYFNPTLDLLTYFLINTFPPRLEGFILGGIHGMTVWLIYRVALLFLPEENPHLFAFFLALIGAYCPQFICGIGMSLGDLTVGIFVLSSIYFLILFIKQKKISYLAFSGILLGAGIGLKNTNAFYAIGAFLSLLLLYRTINHNFDKTNIRAAIFKNPLFLWVMALILGLIITNGYWMVFLYLKFGNPFFPFLNGVFHSSYFPDINWRDIRFLPKSTLEAFLYPFYFSFQGRKVDDIPFYDIRFAFCYSLLLLVFLKIILRKILIKHLSLAEKWLIAFFIFSYLTWEISFSFLRYAVILEMLTPLLIYLLVSYLFNQFYVRALFLFLLFSLITITMKTGNAERGNWNSDSYFGFQIPQQVHNIRHAVVFIPTNNFRNMGHLPLSVGYLIPYLPSDWHFVGIPFNTNTNNAISPDTAKKFLNPNAQLFFLTESKFVEKWEMMFKNYNYHLEKPCDPIDIARGVRRNTLIYLCKIQLTKKD